MAEEKKKSVFETLNAIDVSKKTKEKGGLTYLSWSSAWAEVKKLYPETTFWIIPQYVDDRNYRFWHDDGRSGWVHVKVTIEDQTHEEYLAIMDFKNKAIPADQITATEANKAVKRCLVKALALHGLGLYIYEGEDLPEESVKVIELREAVTDLINKKCKLSDSAKEKVAEYCKDAERKSCPWMPDDAVTGNPKNIDDVEILSELKQLLQTVRK